MEANAKKRIIYIEDDPEMIDLVELILNRHGFEVQGAHGGRQGLDFVHQQLPDLILLDLMMPDLDGWDVYQQLKAEDETKDVPVIVITAKTQTIDKVLGLHIAKVDDYISKPFRPQELLDSIEKVFASK
jgi:two-component system, OmpR family, response regulator VicR